MSSIEQEIFKNNSTTYYFSSQFFPKKAWEDVSRLYSFVRVADNYVDSLPPQPEKFYALRTAWNKAKNDPNFNPRRSDSDSVDTRVIKNIVHLSRHYNFNREWVESFFDTMQSDLNHSGYRTLDDSLAYVYGSAEVVGLMMARFMNLPDEALPSARLQGRAMQWLNFIRDLDEDTRLGRCYFPKGDLRQFDLPNLLPQTAKIHSKQFADFVHLQLARYKQWQAEAERGFEYIPPRLRSSSNVCRDI